jgi:hypothetical protein
MKRLLAWGGLLTILACAGCCDRPGLFNRSYANYPYPPSYVNPCACQPQVAQTLPGPAAQTVQE